MNPVALITGSGRKRIGQTVAESLAKAGYDIALHYHRSQSEAEEATESLREHGVQAEAFQADVTDENSVQSLVENVQKRFGQIDALINTASIWSSKPLEQVTAADVRENFDVNALGTFLCGRAVGLQMVQQSTGGCIINLGDWAIERPYVNHAAYFVAKGSIPTMTRMLAVELASRNPQVRVNCIHPGPVMFPPHLDEAEQAAMIDSTLIKTANRPESISIAVRMLIENPMATGVCLPIDGGRTIYAPGSDRYDQADEE